ncbi:MAG TPA: hypothetical protein VM933_06375 [Acidimicrobiales bacterium]|nr:hypothetical protein [Acidimicrobiales bacterium]
MAGASENPPVRRRRFVVLPLVVLALVVGFAAAALVFRPDPAPSAFDGVPSVSRLDLPARRGGPEAAAPAVAPVVAEEPSSAREALQRYLDAEVARQYDVSFALVDAKTRESEGPVAAWSNSRANRLLPEQFTIVDEVASPDGTDVTVSAIRTPAVSPQTGLVPARSQETWRVVKAEGWRVLRGRPADVRPELPSDAAATAVGAAWLERAAACDATGAAALQLSVNLLGSPDLRDATCKNRSTWSAGSAIPVSEISNSTVIVSAYGPGVGRWARAVPVTGAGRFTIVLVPLGAEWRVTGLVPEGSPRP